MEGRAEYLAALGIEDWRQRRSLAEVMTAAPTVAQGASAPVPAAAGESWDTIAAEVAECRKCGLCETRTRTVFGVGDRNAHWLVVGEAPGAEEDKQGEPFVGRAGGLLNSMLRGIGLAREQVFIANVLKCRPPNNRDPAPAEVAQCLPYLERQIALLQPAHHAGRRTHRRAEPAGHRHAHRQAARPCAQLRRRSACRWWSPITRPTCCARPRRSARHGRTSSSRVAWHPARRRERASRDTHPRHGFRRCRDRGAARAAFLCLSVERCDLPRLPARRLLLLRGGARFHRDRLRHHEHRRG